MHKTGHCKESKANPRRRQERFRGTWVSFYFNHWQPDTCFKAALLMEAKPLQPAKDGKTMKPPEPVVPPKEKPEDHCIAEQIVLVCFSTQALFAGKCYCKETA